MSVRALVARPLRMLGVLLVVSIGVFTLTTMIPGDPVAIVYGTSATPEQIAMLRAELGLDQSAVQRFGSWLGGVVTLDFGNSLLPPYTPVSSTLSSALSVTLELTLLAVLMTLVVSIPLGAAAAYYEGSALDRLVGSLSFGLLSVPSFVMGLFLILLLVFNPDVARFGLLAAGITVTALVLRRELRRRDGGVGVYVVAMIPLAVGLLAFFLLPTFPRQGWIPISEGLGANLKHSFLPALTMALGVIPLWTQLLRADMQATLRQDFVTVARTRGATPLQLVFREALRPSLFSLVTVAALSFGTLLAGSVIVETIYGLPGLGKALMTAITSSDYPVLQAGVLIAATVFVLLNAAVDASYALLDPRIRRGSH